MANPMKMIFKIRERLAKESIKKGLKLRGMAAVPGDDINGPHHIQALFTLADADIPKSNQSELDWQKFQEEQAKNRQTEMLERAKEDAQSLAEELTEKLQRPDQGIL